MLIYSHVRDTLEGDQVVSVEMLSPCITPLSVLRLIQIPNQETDINLWVRDKCIFNFINEKIPGRFVFFPMNLILALYQSFRLEVKNQKSSPTDTVICFVWEEYFK